jgi:predicted NBD/HSP70 family sugar kinase
MSRCLQDAIAKSGIPRQHFLGIGITVPGRANHETGVIVNLPTLANWNAVPVRDILQKQINLPVFVENDVNSRMLAMKWTGDVDISTDAALITITDGVGIAILSGEKLYYGAHFNASELGHTTLQYDGRLCSCGNHGCIETFVSEQTILEKAQACHDFHKKDAVTMTDVITVAKTPKGSKVYDVLTEVAGFIAITLEHLVKAYDPRVILLDSNWLTEFPEIFYFITDNLFTRCRWLHTNMIDIRLVQKKDYWRGSMACVVLEEALNNAQDNCFQDFLCQ